MVPAPWQCSWGHPEFSVNFVPIVFVLSFILLSLSLPMDSLQLICVYIDLLYYSEDTFAPLSNRRGFKDTCSFETAVAFVLLSLGPSGDLYNSACSYNRFLTLPFYSTQSIVTFGCELGSFPLQDHFSPAPNPVFWAFTSPPTKKQYQVPSLLRCEGWLPASYPHIRQWITAQSPTLSVAVSPIPTSFDSMLCWIWVNDKHKLPSFSGWQLWKQVPG